MTAQNMGRYVRELSGDTVIMVGGIPQRIISRYWTSPYNQVAAQYILEKFQSFGLQARLQYNSSHNVNVIARKTGYLYPNLKIVIGAHYDNIRPNISSADTMKGADDNGSGVAAVLEAARLLANYNPKLTIEFVAFDEEEIGYYGSLGYADSCVNNPNEDVYGCINMDMIAWDGNNDGLIRIMTSEGCDILADMLIRSYQLYNLNLTPLKSYNTAGSDHIGFWQHNIGAISSIEPAADFHPYYHSMGDVFSLLNMSFFQRNARANLATVMSIADELVYFITHTPLQSSSDSTDIVAEAYLIFGAPVAVGQYAPRLYYRTSNGPYSYLNAFERIDNLYRFRIPGQSPGSQVQYYFAAQDSTGVYLASLPNGASGLNPPGTTPPPQVFRYSVYKNVSYSSSNQKPILDNQYTKDTIYFPYAGTIQDVKLTLNLTHANDGDLLISLLKDNNQVHLSQFNGTGGQNFTGTVFHDTALVSITAGTPPYTGLFRPQQALSGLNNIQSQGYWVLRIYDARAGSTGTLLNWSISVKYAGTISVKNTEAPVPEKFSLGQNYPNPFNPVTRLKFSLPESGTVSIKVYDLLGREVAALVNERLTAGVYETMFDGSRLSSGVYFYRMSAGDFTETKKMLLLK